jgi:type II secretion system protein G
MNDRRKTERAGGFTLIELLIVVAIIAILAAIAVPNFLEAQTRSKVSRAAADLRSIRTAVEAYYIDNNAYPETDLGEGNPTLLGVGLIRVTTPVAFMTSIPGSPFMDEYIGHPGFVYPDPLSGTPKNSNRMKSYLWLNAKHIPGVTTDNTPADNLDDNYNADRSVYLAGGNLAMSLAVRSQGNWMLKSVGPNNIDDRDSQQLTSPLTPADARVYDPTNGTTSRGDLIVFSDTQGFAQQK